jgi:hypothetical protein
MDRLKIYNFVSTSEGKKPLRRIILKCTWNKGIWCDGAE